MAPFLLRGRGGREVIIFSVHQVGHVLYITNYIHFSIKGLAGPYIPTGILSLCLMVRSLQLNSLP